MRKILVILLLLISAIAGATTYYVAPSTATPAGNDSNAGTITAPWLTWYKAIQTANAGDTVFFRGGVYPMYPTNGQGIPYNPGSGYGHDGTRADPIVYINYPDETPILDLSNTVPTVTYLFAIRLVGVDNVKFIGLTFRNLKQTLSTHVVEGVRMESRCNNITWERCVVHDFGGCGWLSNDNDTINYINSDAYNCVDSLGHMPGNYGSGFSTGNTTIFTALTTFTNCRAWRCSDQGFGTRGGRSLVVIDGCWSFSNGALPTGGGHGYKLGYMGDTAVAHGVDVIMTNSIAAFNREDGITDNANAHPTQYMLLYNNTVYYNGQDPTYTANRRGFNFYANSTGSGYATFRNNISYNNYAGDVFRSNAVHSNNTWDASVTVTDADFISVDSTGITAARQADGSLPDNDCYNYFLRLAYGSDLIDAGTDVEIDYSGAAPDIGWDEYDSDPSPATNILTFTFAEQTGGATINTTNHTVAIEVDYTADITDLTPTITLSYGATVIPASGTARNFTNPVPYTVTAEDGVTYQEWTVTVTQEESPVTPASTGRIVKLNGKIVKR